MQPVGARERRDAVHPDDAGGGAAGRRIRRSSRPGRRSRPCTRPRASRRYSRPPTAIASSSWRPSRWCRIPSRSTSTPTAGCTSSRCAPTCRTCRARERTSRSAASSCSRTRTTTGRWTRRRVFLDSLVMPRAVKVLERGVLVAETPNLWLARDTNGDLRADTRELVRDDYGTKQSNPEHNANGLLWGIDNWIHNANYARPAPHRRRRQLHLPQDAGRGAVGRVERRVRAALPQQQRGPAARRSRAVALRGCAAPSLSDAARRLRAAHAATWRSGPRHKTPAVNRGYREQTLRPPTARSRTTRPPAARPRTSATGCPPSCGSSVFVTEPAGNLVGPVRCRARTRDGSRSRARRVRALGVHHQRATSASAP